MRTNITTNHIMFNKSDMKIMLLTSMMEQKRIKITEKCNNRDQAIKYKIKKGKRNQMLVT